MKWDFSLVTLAKPFSLLKPELAFRSAVHLMNHHWIVSTLLFFIFSQKLEEKILLPLHYEFHLRFFWPSLFGSLCLGPIRFNRWPAYWYGWRFEPWSQHIWSIQQSRRTEQSSTVTLLPSYFSPGGLSCQRLSISLWATVPCHDAR